MTDDRIVLNGAAVAAMAEVVREICENVRNGVKASLRRDEAPADGQQ